MRSNERCTAPLQSIRPALPNEAAPQTEKLLLELPTESVEEVVGWIWNSADLSALAQTCKSLYDMIVPDHLHWRCLLLSSKDETTLHSLSTKRRLAANVGRIELDTFNKQPAFYRPPRNQEVWFGSGEEVDNELLERAAGNLANLVSLRVQAFYVAKAKSFMTKLGPIPELVVDAGAPGHELDNSDFGQQVMQGLRGGCTRFEWLPDTYVVHPDAQTAALQMLAQRCPELQIKKIGSRYDKAFGESVSVELLTAFWSAPWPNLREAHLKNVKRSPESNAMDVFLNAHPLLEVVELEGDFPCFNLLSTALPNLREIKIDQGSSAQADSTPPLDSHRGIHRRPV